MRMIAHSFDSYDHAVRAVKALESAGVPHDDISLVSGDKSREIGTTVAGDTTENTGAGTGASIGTVLGGGAGLLAGLGMLAIPGVGPVVAAGWLVATLAGAGVGAAAGGLLGSLTGAGIDEADAKAYTEHVGRGGTLVTVRADDAMAPDVEYILEHGEARTALLGDTAAATRPAATSAGAVPGTTSGTTTAEDGMVQLVKEDLVVGKRAVEAGGVRVSTHVVETPVEQEVRLREENVRVERRPINRPLTGLGADAFRERTLTASSMKEEAVVGKEARVVEEIGLRKEANERVETVRDTVRETKADVEQVPGSTTTVPGNTVGTNAMRDNPATRAVDRTLDTNLSGENPGRKL